MVDWVAALNGVATAVQITKDLRALDQSMDAAVAKAQLVSLMEQLSNVRMQLLDAREESRDQEDEIKRLSTFSISLEGKSFEHGFYFDTNEAGHPRGEPYCSYCIETRQGLFHMRQLGISGLPWECPHCKTEYLSAPAYDWT